MLHGCEALVGHVTGVLALAGTVLVRRPGSRADAACRLSLVGSGERMETVETSGVPEHELPLATGVDGLWRYRNLALAVADAVLIVGSFVMAFYFRAMIQPHLVRHAGPYVEVKVITLDQVDAYLRGAIFIAAAWVFFIWRAGGYESGLRGIASPIVRMRLVLVAGVKAFAMAIVISYMFQGTLLSRPVYVTTALLALASMVLVRLLFLALDRDLAAQGMASQWVLVAGTDNQAREFARRLQLTGSTVRLAGFLSVDQEAGPGVIEGVPVLGRFEQFRAICEEQPAEKIVLSNAALAAVQKESSPVRLIDLLNFCEAGDVALYTLPDVMDVAITRNDVGTFSQMPLVKLQDAALHRGYAVVKRLMDTAVALVMLAAGAPVWLAIAAAIKLASKGPAIFSQVRIGLHGRPFRMYKFRSMVADAESQLESLVDFEKLDVPGFKLKDDPRVTKIGRFLRRTSLDEVPQLLNVLRGEMSLVGPRPELPDLVDRYSPWQRRRLKAKPGITGYQQVMARGQPLAGAIGYDLIYLKHQSFLLDLYILLKTVAVVLKGSGVTH